MGSGPGEGAGKRVTVTGTWWQPHTPTCDETIEN